MESTRRVEEDLEYVRDVVGRGEGFGAPQSIWFLLAAIVLVGCTLVDVAPRHVPAFWMLAAPVGFIASMWLGWRSARSAGIESRRDVNTHLFHWGGMLLAIFLLVPLAATGPLSGPAMGQAALVLVALGYFLAGIHIAKPFIWIAPLVVVGYALTFVLDAWAWTITGALMAVGLVVTGRVSHRV